jgi:hypothetical protein
MAFSEMELRAIYGLGSNDFVLVPVIEEADFVVVPMSWNYYLAKKQVPLAEKIIHQARTKGKKVLIQITGDRHVTVPFDDAYVLKPGGYRTRRSPREFTYPIFFDDPLTAWLGKDSLSFRRKGAKPVVGFCGQARIDAVRELLHFGGSLLHNLLTLYKGGRDDPRPLLSSGLHRQRILNRLSSATELETNFIIRKHYRAGAKTKHDRLRTSREFYRNIQESDYTMCFRGGGNFSKRFYETLAMGRIPLFINTDCHLPFEDEINWHKYCLWVDIAEVDSLPQKVAGHYNNLDESTFMDLQKESRRLWEEWLNFGAFHRQFAQKLMQLP